MADTDCQLLCERSKQMELIGGSVSQWKMMMIISFRDSYSLRALPRITYLIIIIISPSAFRCGECAILERNNEPKIFYVYLMARLSYHSFLLFTANLSGGDCARAVSNSGWRKMSQNEFWLGGKKQLINVPLCLGRKILTKARSRNTVAQFSLIDFNWSIFEYVNYLLRIIFCFLLIIEKEKIKCLYIFKLQILKLNLTLHLHSIPFRVFGY